MHWIYLIYEFHNWSWITELNELFHDILIYWDAPVLSYILYILKVLRIKVKVFTVLFWKKMCQDGFALILLLHYGVCCILFLNMFKVVKFKVPYCWVIMHHVVKYNILLVLLSWKKKEKEKQENIIFHICTRTLNECTSLRPTTDYFENESNNVYCQNIYKLLPTIWRGCIWRTRTSHTVQLWQLPLNIELYNALF